MAARRTAREEDERAGGPERDTTARPKTNAMKVSAKVMGQRDEGRRSIAARQKKDASGGG